MKRDNKALYEKIMQNVSKVVKKTLYESNLDDSDDYILDKFLGAVNYFCKRNGLGDNEVKCLIAAYTDYQQFQKISEMANLSVNDYNRFEESLDDETYEYMTSATEMNGNGDITFDSAYDKFCEMYYN